MQPNCRKNTSSPPLKKPSSTKVHTAFSSLKAYSSSSDSLPAAFIQWSLDLLAAPITDLFNACLDNTYFPTAWKSGLLLTIPKVSAHIDRSSHKSQRPITLLLVLGKGFEKILLDRFNNMDKQWHNKAQRGFIKELSTDSGSST